MVAATISFLVVAQLGATQQIVFDCGHKDCLIMVAEMDSTQIWNLMLVWVRQLCLADTAAINTITTFISSHK